MLKQWAVYLDEILQFDFIVQVRVWWNVKVWTTVVAVSQSRSDMQPRPLATSEPPQTKLNSFDKSHLGSLTQHKTNIPVLENTASVFPGDVN